VGSGSRTIERQIVNQVDGGSIPPTAISKLRQFRNLLWTHKFSLDFQYLREVLLCVCRCITVCMWVCVHMRFVSNVCCALFNTKDISIITVMGLSVGDNACVVYTFLLHGTVGRSQ